MTPPTSRRATGPGLNKMLGETRFDRGLAAVELREVVLAADGLRGREPTHSKIDSLANSFSSLGLSAIGRSGTAWNWVHAASSSMNRHRSTSTSRGWDTAASTVNSVIRVPSNSASRRIRAS
jgi:hypothetical protein